MNGWRQVWHKLTTQNQIQFIEDPLQQLCFTSTISQGKSSVVIGRIQRRMIVFLHSKTNHHVTRKFTSVTPCTSVESTQVFLLHISMYWDRMDLMRKWRNPNLLDSSQKSPQTSTDDHFPFVSAAIDRVEAPRIDLTPTRRPSDVYAWKAGHSYWNEAAFSNNPRCVHCQQSRWTSINLHWNEIRKS